jgi:8-hydroxy-5-deazaflavin:NADPH oxidoreductase
VTRADNKSVATIGIIGAGKSGIALTRQALAAGYQVRIATSGPAERTALVADILAPGAVAVDADRLADLVDLVILAVPLRRLHDLPFASFADRTVVDVTLEGGARADC